MFSADISPRGTDAPSGPRRASAPRFLSRGHFLAFQTLFLLGVGLHSFPSKAANEAPLTLGAAQDIAVGRSSRLQAATFAVESSQATAAAASQLPDPTLTLGVENLPVAGGDRFSLDRDFMTMRQIGVMQEFTRPQKRRLRDQRAQQAIRVAEAQRTEASTAIRRAVAIAWLDRYYAELAAARMTQVVTVVKGQVASAESAYRQGRGNTADVLAVRGELLQLEDGSAAATLEVRTATISLSRWIAEAADRPLAGKPQIDALPFQFGAVEAHLRTHPDLESLLREEELALTEVDLARAERRPDWTVGLTYGRRGPDYSDMVSVGVSVPIPANRADRQDRVVASRLAEARSAAARHQDMFEQHLAEVRVLLERWQSIRLRRDRFTTTLMPLAADRVAAAAAAYRGGQAPLMDVVSALRHEAEVQLEVVNLEAQTARLWAELTFLVPPTAGDPQ